MIHFFKKSVSHITLPEKFTYPFHYIPHPLCVAAAEEVKTYIASRKEWQEELAVGKMFGVLIVETTSPALLEDTNRKGKRIGYLAAFSGNLAGKNRHRFFVPPVYDLLQPDGFFKKEEEQISAINARLREWEHHADYLSAQEQEKAAVEEARIALELAKATLKKAKEEREKRRQTQPALSEEEQNKLIRESQYQKAEYKRLEKAWKKRLEELAAATHSFEIEIERLKTERKIRSAALQQQLFSQFRMLNAKGEVKDLCDIFAHTVQRVPPGGAGECALPKLLQYAYLHRLRPLAMAEFWWGSSPKNEIRHHGYYYPSCKGKCEPILQHMLQGLEVDENPLTEQTQTNVKPEIVYEDKWLIVINKPAGLLTVPGKEEATESVFSLLKKKYPDATGPMIVHRLDMATSGLLLVAKTKEVHQLLQAQFEKREIKKRYIALLDGVLSEKMPAVSATGRIELPLCADYMNRPQQMVCDKHGKEAVTDYRIINESEGHTRIAFYPLTGRTHQLRVHAAHPQGLHCPILGDELYGKKDNRLYLHAEYIEFHHPISGDLICLQKEPDF